MKRLDEGEKGKLGRLHLPVAPRSDHMSNHYLPGGNILNYKLQGEGSAGDRTFSWPCLCSQVHASCTTVRMGF